jgi:hypothetical protein
MSLMVIKAQVRYKPAWLSPQKSIGTNTWVLCSIYDTHHPVNEPSLNARLKASPLFMVLDGLSPLCTPTTKSCWAKISYVGKF